MEARVLASTANNILIKVGAFSFKKLKIRIARHSMVLHLWQVQKFTPNSSNLYVAPSVAKIEIKISNLFFRLLSQTYHHCMLSNSYFQFSEAKKVLS